jgi:GT2 family glycosyltransferase
MIKVYSIILNWNNYQDTKETLISFINQDYQNHEIILIDNHSEEIIYQTLKNEFIQVTHLRTPSNLGYTGGNNYGINYCLNKEDGIIIIANNDIELGSKILVSQIVEAYKFLPEMKFITGPKLYDYFERSIIQESGTTIFYSKGDKYFFNDYITSVATNNVNLEFFDGVPGAFMVAPSFILRDLGGFDEKLFMYGDETDFCFRAWVKGYYCGINTNWTVYHKGENSSQNETPKVLYYKTRNLLYLLKKHRRNVTHIDFFLKKFRKFVLSKAKQVIIEEGFNSEKLRLLLLGVLHGVLGKYGKY